MKHHNLNIAVLLISHIMGSSDAALLLNIRLLDPSQEINTSSSCQCKNRCFVTPNCTYTSWIKNGENSFMCQSTNETEIVFKESEGWNTYCRFGYCVTSNGDFIPNGSVYRIEEGCQQYECVKSTLVENVPPNVFQYHEGLGCVHYPVEKLNWTDARDHCNNKYKAVLVNIDTEKGVEHLKRYASEIGMEKGFWIAASRTTEGGTWQQNFGNDIYWNSTLWYAVQSEAGDSRGQCTKSFTNYYYLLGEKDCANENKFVCQMAPKPSYT